MDKPAQPIAPDDEVGPVDDYGQQIWSPEEEAAIAQLRDDPEYLQSLAESDAQIERGEWYTTEQVFAELERRRRARRDAA